MNYSTLSVVVPNNRFDLNTHTHTHTSLAVLNLLVILPLIFPFQIVLFDLSKRPLERRFLKKDEVIKSGESVYFDGHLVDVGELEGSHQSPVKFNERGTGHNVVERRQSPVKFNEQGTGQNVVGRRQLRHGQKGCHKVYPSAVKG